MTKLERIRNYFIRTNTDDNTTVEYPAFEARYRQSEDTYYLTSINDASIGQYFKFADLLDEGGNAWSSQAILTDWLRQNTGVSTTGDIMQDIPLGLVDGSFAVNKFGANISVAADTQEDVWDGGGTYAYPTTADITHVHQLADQIGLRGADVEVQGLDINWDLVVQTQQLNAADTSTLVALDTPLLRVFRIKLNASETAVSNIHITNAADTIEYALITNGNNQTLMAQYTVPAGKTALMTGLFFSNIDATNKTPTSVEVKMWAANASNGVTFQLKHADAMPQAGSGRQHKFDPYYKFTEKTDIKITAQPQDEDGHVHAGFDLIIQDN